MSINYEEEMFQKTMNQMVSCMSKDVKVSKISIGNGRIKYRFMRGKREIDVQRSFNSNLRCEPKINYGNFKEHPCGFYICVNDVDVMNYNSIKSLVEKGIGIKR